MTVRAMGLLLAGGAARRMGGGDKCLRRLGGRTLLEHAVERATPQCSSLILNANGDASRFERFGLPVVPDLIEGRAGPLAGILTGLRWTARHAPGIDWVVSCPTDTPFLPRDLVARLASEIVTRGADLACASSAGRTHPVVGLWPVGLADDLERAMREDDMRKIDLWTARHRLVTVDFSTDPFDPFFNANRPEDLEEAERILALE